MTAESIVEVCRDVIAPLVRADGGKLYIVSVDALHVQLHLAGACSGCPGATLTTRGVIEPVLRALSPKTKVVVTSGVTIPAGATLLD